MREAVSIAVLCALLSGCATRRESVQAMHAGGYTMVAGFAGFGIGAGLASSDHDGEAVPIATLGVALIAVGALIGIVGLIGEASHPAPESGGYLTITIDAVNVRVDGEDWGATPIERHPVPVGVHHVELRDVVSGTLRRQQDVDVRTETIHRISR